MELLAIPLILLLIILSPVAIWFAFPEYRIYVIIFGVVIAIRLLCPIFNKLYNYIKEKKEKKEKEKRLELLRQKREEEERKRRQEEELLRQKREEEERKRRQEEELLRQKREEEKRKRRQEEELLRQKREEEERKRWQEEMARQEEEAHRWQQMLDDLPSNMLEVSPQEFFALKESAQEFTGVYILHNKSKGMYYVGQSVRVLGRVSQHFTGHGNGDVYADFKYGDTFTIRCLSLVNSGYDSLDALEKDFIKRHNANITGYNRTQGNL